MKKFLSALLALSMTLAMTACGEKPADEGSGSGDGEKKVYTAIFASDQTDDNPRVQAIYWMKDELEKRTDGQIVVDIQANGVLGSATETFGMLSTNAIQMTNGNGWEQLSSRFNIWNLPMTFASYQEINDFSNSELANDIMSELNDPNIYIPAVTYTPGRNIVCSKEVRLPSDMKNLKMRSPNQNPIIDFYKTAGAIPIEMAPTEVYMATKQGTIDGSCNNPANLYDYALYEVSKCFVYCDYMYGPDPLMVNRTWYESLPEDLQKAFNEVAKEAFANLGVVQSTAAAEAAAKMKEKAKITVDVVNDEALKAEWLEFGKSVQDAMIADGTVLQADVDTLNEWLTEYRK